MWVLSFPQAIWGVPTVAWLDLGVARVRPWHILVYNRAPQPSEGLPKRASPGAPLKEGRMLRSHLKSLAGPALISILWVGPALVTNRDDVDASQQTLRPGTSDSSGKKGAERRNQSIPRPPRIINSSVHNLEQAHFNANQMLHVGNPEESDAKDTSKASSGVTHRTNVQRGEAPVVAAGFSGAKAGVVSPMQALSGQRSTRSPGESEHSGPSDVGRR